MRPDRKGRIWRAGQRETAPVRRWDLKFGIDYARRIKEHKPFPHTEWFLDEVFVKNGSNLSLPVIDGGARRAELELAELSLDQKILFYKTAVLCALQDMKFVLSSDAALKRQQASATRQAEILRRVSEQTQANFNAGRMSSLDLIPEEENLIRIEETSYNIEQ